MAFQLDFVVVSFLNVNCSYCGGQVAAFVSADPAQAADNIEHLELELYNRRRWKKWRGVTNGSHT